MKKLIVMIGAVAVMAMGAMAETANTVNVTKFHQSYPYTGKATVEYTVGGALPANAVAEITINTDDASATFTQSNIVTGANTFTVNFASSFGGALVLTNASFVVTITEGAGGGGSSGGLGGVQLWEGGPYWAECNIGASKPEEYGYYFWWGDTVGYTRSGGTWMDDDYYYSGVTWVSSTGQQMSSSPFSSSSCPTYGKDNSALQLAGYIDSTGNLVAAHDAATAHLGAQWRMPTDAEISALINNCTTTWITTNGVPGRLVTGKGAYADRSIFLPAAGLGLDSNLYFPGSGGNYWSSTPNSVTFDYAWGLSFNSSNIGRGNSFDRSGGRSVRPVRGFATTPAMMVTITFNANGGTVSPSSLSYVANGTYNSLPTPTYTGHTFTGWYTEANGGTQVANSSSVPASDTTLYAHWTANDPGDGGIGGIQLWENGPYWAECNVGASKPEEYGYYFWWGDTVGYTRSGGTWTDDYYYSGVTWVSSTGQQMSSSPFLSLSPCPTGNKNNSALQSAGYIDSTGNLVAAHDAATAHLGAPWRMPTDAEFSALISNCTTTWITTNGVSGQLVTGKGNYANRSIFLPAAGVGLDSQLNDLGWLGRYWSSTPYSDLSDYAWNLRIHPSIFDRPDTLRFYGQSVRPVRGFAE